MLVPQTSVMPLHAGVVVLLLFAGSRVQVFIGVRKTLQGGFYSICLSLFTFLDSLPSCISEVPRYSTIR